MLRERAAPWLALLLCLAAATGVFWALPDRGLSLKFERAHWPQAPWTLWSAPFVHLNAKHALLNTGALVLLAAMGVAMRVGALAVCAALLAWPLSTVFLLAWPQVHWVAGLSGLVHALWAVMVGCGLAASLSGQERAPPQWLLAGLTLALLAKLAWESAWVHPLVMQSSWAFMVVKAAHLAGALAGLVAVGLVFAGAACGGYSRSK